MGGYVEKRGGKRGTRKDKTYLVRINLNNATQFCWLLCCSPYAYRPPRVQMKVPGPSKGGDIERTKTDNPVGQS